MTALAITGMHRAGTSMVAHALSRAGVYLGAPSRMLPPAADNPEGFFEHAGFIRLADDLLEGCGGAWDHLPAAAPFDASDPRVAAFAGDARELVTELDIAPVWGWKDPRTSLTAAFWLDVVPHLRFVVCVRNPLEVAVSLRRRNGMSYVHALSLWRGYYAALLDAVPVEQRLVTHYDAHLADPAAELARLCEFAGLGASEPEPVADRAKRHHQLALALADAGVGAEVIELYERLCAESGHVPAPAAAPAVALDRRAVELALAQQSLERYGRYVAGLQKDLAENEARVAELAAAGRADVLAELVTRLDALEDAQHDARYAAEELAGHPDPAAVRAGRGLVRTHVPRRERVLVAGGDAALLDICGRPTAPFATGGDDDLSAIARLEAARLGGGGYLLVPRPALPELDRLPGFADHLLGRYPLVDERDGLLVDVRSRLTVASGWPAWISVTVERLVPGAAADPAILDWTGLGIARYLPGRNVFSPPDGEALPYLAGSVDIVVVADAARAAEARRVAARAVITMSDRGRPHVEAVELLDDTPPEADPAVRYLVAGAPDDAWLRLFREAVGDAVEIVSEPVTGDELTSGVDLIGVVEPGVLPLPGCANASYSTLLAGERAGAVAVKVVAADGRLEAAGEFVFADGSTTGVAAGAPRLAEPWHEYVRDTCGGRGLLYVGAAALGKLGGPELDRLAAEPHPMLWAAAAWRAGLRVRYQPAAAAVRATVRPEPELMAGVVAAAWAPALARRPHRPDPLDPSGWRSLVARDDVEGAWR